MKNREFFFGMMFMQFLAGVAFYAWKIKCQDDGEKFLCVMAYFLYLAAGILCLVKWEMEEGK